ncbi:MAG: hypothetical protein ACT4P0_12850 [Panacagrimonas sp.]
MKAMTSSDQPFNQPMIDRSVLRIAGALFATALLITAMIVLVPEQPMHAIGQAGPAVQASVGPSAP